MSEACPPRGLQWWRLVIRYANSEGVPLRSVVVAAIVGTVLNLINQGDRLLAGAPLDLTKLVLTYIVPYFVSTYGAVSFRLQADKRLQQRSRLNAGGEA